MRAEGKHHLSPPNPIPKPKHKTQNIRNAPPCQALVAEMVGNFTKRLTEPYGINVRELTGDINLTKQEIDETQARRAFLNMGFARLCSVLGGMCLAVCCLVSCAARGSRD